MYILFYMQWWNKSAVTILRHTEIVNHQSYESGSINFAMCFTSMTKIICSIQAVSFLSAMHSKQDCVLTILQGREGWWIPSVTLFIHNLSSKTTFTDQKFGMGRKNCYYFQTDILNSKNLLKDQNSLLSNFIYFIINFLNLLCWLLLL